MIITLDLFRLAKLSMVVDLLVQKSEFDSKSVKRTYMHLYPDCAELAHPMLTNKLLKAIIFDLDHTLINSGIDFLRMKRSMIRYVRSKFPSFGELDDKWTTYEIVDKTVKFLERNDLLEVITATMCELDEIMTRVEMDSVAKATMIDGVMKH